MKKIYKKLISLLLALIFVSSFVPPDITFASVQDPVKFLSITDISDQYEVSDGSVPLYKLSFKWDKVAPPSYAAPDSTNPPVVGYILKYKNVTKAEAEIVEDINISSLSTSTEGGIDYYTLIKQNLKLTAGSIYEFTVIPYHIETRTNSQGGIENYRKEGTSVKAYYMTAIVASATGTKDDSGATTKYGITVVFDNPTIGGKNVFDSYNIYFDKTKNPHVTDILTSSTVKSVNVKASDLVSIRTDGKVEYTIFHNDINFGTFYDIKIVPVLGLDPTKPTLPRDEPYEKVINETNSLTLSKNQRNRVNSAFTEAELKIANEGSNYIKLTWDNMVNNGSVTIDKVVLYRSENEDMSGSTPIYTVRGADSNQKINSFITEKPTKVFYYRVVYYPAGVDSSPNDPMNVEEDFNSYNKARTNIAKYDPSIEKFYPNAPTILYTADNNKTKKGNEELSMTISFGAFVREAYTDEEKKNAITAEGKDKGRYIDKNVIYDIYVTDDSAFLSDAALKNFKINDKPINAKDLEEYLFPDGTKGQPTDTDPKLKVWAYDYGVNQYVTKDESGSYVYKKLEENKVYYIRIIARRTPGEEESKYSEAAHYIEPLGETDTRPVVLQKPPLRIRKDANGNELITKDSIEIEWDTSWYEIFNAADKQWYSKVAKNGSAIVFGDDKIDALIKAGTITKADVYEFGGSSYASYADVVGKVGNLPVRYMDLAGAGYKLHVVAYEEMEKAGGYKNYFETITEFSKEYTGLRKPIVDEAIWKTIFEPVAPKDELPVRSYVVKEAQKPAGALIPNTPYVMILWPYKVIGGQVKESYYPNNVTGTTLSEGKDVDIKPTIPIIEGVAKTDLSVTVRFEYKEALSYELFWSETMGDYPDKGIVIPNNEIHKTGTVKTENGKTWMYYTINKLFPETTYYVWVQAYSKTEKSDYSNAVSLKTDELKPPKSPDGLGLANSEHVSIYNKESGKKYVNRDFNYIVMEWYRDMKDKDPEVDEENPQNNQNQANPTEATATETLLAKLLKETYLVKFNKDINGNDLAANRDYYFRAKTRLTVTKTEDGVTHYYQYVVQMSTDEEFTEYVEVIVPAEIGEVDEVYTLMKESPWSNTVKISTGKSKDEYDGEKSPETYPLPKQDFEVTYDKNTDTLTYRYRSDGKDAFGNNDNFVDQRFISQLVANKAYKVSIDVSSYDGKEIKNKIIELPYSITNTLKERKIDLIVKSRDITFSYPPGFVDNSEVKAIKDYGIKSKIKININDVEKGLPDISGIGTYGTKPQKMGITVITPTKTLVLTKTEKPYGVESKISSRTLPMDTNVAAYFYTENDAAWVKSDKQAYDSKTAMVNYSMLKMATHSVIGKNLPKNEVSNTTTDAMNTLATYIEITDLKTYNPNASANSNQINKIMTAVAKGQKTVGINTPLTSEEQKMLEKAGIVTPSGGTVSREVAINSLVKLYEVKTKAPIKDFGKVETTTFTDIKDATDKYKTSLLKAGAIGFYEGNLSKPKDPITLEDLFFFADMIIQDAGLK